MGKTEYITVIIIFYLIFIAFIVAIVIYIWQYQIKKKQHHLVLENQNETHQKELLIAQIEIQKVTMNEIGREIHDNIGQKLTLASLNIHQLNFDNNMEDVAHSIQNIHSLIDSSLEELRQLSHSLTNDAVNEKEIDSLLATECKKVNALKKCVFQSHQLDERFVLPYQYKNVLLRITQEFIQNSIKHANCQTITVTLTGKPNSLELKLTDDGKGFALHQDKSNWGIGLQNIENRTKIINGQLELSSNSTGTSLTLLLPILN